MKDCSRPCQGDETVAADSAARCHIAGREGRALGWLPFKAQVRADDGG
jgi:hypothetical protein